MSARVVAVYSTKGGVGKTTTAVNLAWQAASEGSPVLLWDLDPQASATWLLDVKQKLRGGADALVHGRTSAERAIRESRFPRIDVLPADESYRDLDIALDAGKKSESRIAATLKPLRRDYDVIVLDCPPGASLVATNALNAADVVVLPVVPSALSLRSIAQVRQLLAAADGRTPVVAFLNQVDRRKLAHRVAAESLPAADPDMSDIVVPASVVVERMGERRAPLGEYAPTAETTRAFAGLWNRIKRS